MTITIDPGVRPAPLTDAERIAVLERQVADLKEQRRELQDERDCRLCAKFTTKSGGCTSTVRCVDSDQYKATTPRQYWVSGAERPSSAAAVGSRLERSVRPRVAEA